MTWKKQSKTLIIGKYVDKKDVNLRRKFTTNNINLYVRTDKYSYSWYGIVFDSRSLVLISSFDFGKIVVIFVVDNSSFVHVGYKKKYILAL